MKTFTKTAKLFRMNYRPFRAAMKPLFFAFLAGNLFFLSCGDSGGDGGAPGSTSFTVMPPLTASGVSIPEGGITIEAGSEETFTVSFSKEGSGRIQGSAFLEFSVESANQALKSNISISPPYSDNNQ